MARCSLGTRGELGDGAVEDAEEGRELRDGVVGAGVEGGGEHGAGGRWVAGGFAARGGAGDDAVGLHGGFFVGRFGFCGAGRGVVEEIRWGGCAEVEWRFG